MRSSNCMPQLCSSSCSLSHVYCLASCSLSYGWAWTVLSEGRPTPDCFSLPTAARTLTALCFFVCAVIDAVQWGVDYLVKAHSAPNRFVAVLGNDTLDFAYYGSVERYDSYVKKRTTCYIDTKTRGACPGHHHADPSGKGGTRDRST